MVIPGGNTRRNAERARRLLRPYILRPSPPLHKSETLVTRKGNCSAGNAKNCDTCRQEVRRQSADWHGHIYKSLRSILTAVESLYLEQNAAAVATSVPQK